MSRWVYSLELTADLYVSRFGSVGFPVDIGALQFRAVGSTYGRPVAVAVDRSQPAHGFTTSRAATVNLPRRSPVLGSGFRWSPADS